MKMTKAADLRAGDVLVGDLNGRSQITGDVYPSSAMQGLMAVETEHGTLYLDPDEEYPVA